MTIGAGKPAVTAGRRKEFKRIPRRRRKARKLFPGSRGSWEGAGGICVLLRRRDGRADRRVCPPARGGPVRRGTVAKRVGALGQHVDVVSRLPRARRPPPDAASAHRNVLCYY